MKLTTKRLIIRDMELEDLDRFDSLANSDFVLKYLCMYKMDRDGSLAYIRQMIEKQRDFAIALKDTNELIGKIHLDEDALRFGTGAVDLAYWLGEPYTRQGYMTEALRAVIKWLFNSQGCEIASAQALAPNTASQALLKGLGFTQEGILRRAMNWEGTVYDSVCFSLLREEFSNLWAFEKVSTAIDTPGPA